MADEVAKEVAKELAEEESKRRRNVIPFPSRHVQRWLVAAAAIVLMVGGGVGYRWHQGSVAKRQVMQAFQIAGGSLNHLQAHLKQVSQ